MKNHILRGRSFQRLAAFFLCALLTIGLFPVNSFAAANRAASSAYGDVVIGSDGKAYTSPVGYYTMTYHSDGTTSYARHNGGVQYKHFVLTDESGSFRWVYCVEGGVRFGNSDEGYYSEHTENSVYFNQLPKASQRGIMLTSLYGWQPGEPLPMSGINNDDWYMAAQCIMWEYQQQLRSDPYSRHSNGSVAEDTFYRVVKGRPAEKVYDWILEQIASHSTIPSFAGETESNAPVHQLEWDPEAKVYMLTLTDTNNLNIDLEAISSSGISVTRSGNRYTFTSKNMIESPIALQFRKDVPVGDTMLIWGREGWQTMMTGAKDPVTFYMQIQTETYGKAKIIKASEDGIVEGIPFTITGNGVNETVTTGANGTVDLELLPGTYLVSEQPIDRYVTPALQYITIESGQTSSVQFTNILKKFRVMAYKTDADTGNAQGDATLGGAVYGLYKGGELVDTYTTGPDGSFLTGYYVCGDDWTLRELEPSTGYLLDETVHEVGASPTLYDVELNTAESHVTEKVIYGNIQLIKHTDDPDPDVADEEHSDDGNASMVEKPEEGAVFEIYLKSAGSYENAKESESDLLTTDSDGFAASKLLPYGHYTVHQISGEDDKAFVPDFTVFINENGRTYSYILNNDAITARIRIEKRDAETGAIIPMPGTGFRIKDLTTGEFISQTIYYPNPETLDVFYVSDEGWLMLPEPLPAHEFELYEVSAPEGYVLSDEPVPFSVDGSEAVVTVVQYNQPQKGQITISKSGEVFSSVQENEGLYLPIYEVAGLPGAIYDLIADEDIYTGDGTLRVAKDTVVETLTTGEDSSATSGLLYLGCYRLEERQSPTGMVLDTEPVYTELSYAGQTVEVTQVALGLYDERQKVSIDLYKSLETDEQFHIGLEEEYKDISFGLYASEDIVALDGSVIPTGGLLEVVSVSPVEEASGQCHATFTADLPFGSFYVQERSTNEAFILSDQQYPVVFEYAGQETSTVSITANEGNAVENQIIRGRVDGIKVGENPEGEDAIPLEGALIGLFAPDAEEFSEETALYVTESAENGSFSFEDIPFGHWIISEISSPALYTISPEQHHIYVGTDGQVIEIQIDNTLIRGSVQVIKTEAIDDLHSVESDNKNPFMHRLPGAVFVLYEDTNGDKKLDDNDKLIGELEETDSGVHEMTGLLAKGFFVKEKTAPESFVLDPNAYYFEITEDGQVVVVENGETGYGFVNEAYRGNLKIVKDSSDGRKDGFAFEVKSEDGTYCETFTSPSSGVIEIKGLRIGIYTVTEVKNKASEDYIIPDGATVEIKSDETAVVQFFNEKPENPDRPETPDTPEKPVPQTGDDYGLYLWMGTLGIAVIGSTVSLILFLHKGKHGAKANPRRCKTTATIFLISIALVVGSGFMLAQEIGQYKESAATYAKLSDYLTVQDDPSVENEGEAVTEGNEASTALLPSVDFAALLEEGPDVKAWLELPGTVISYPVVQCEDNSYYLKHLYDGTANKNGCPFIDYENEPDFSDNNTIIYGHNMRDGSMFSSLREYAEQSYFDEHPQMYLMTPEGSYLVELFSAFITSPSEAGSATSPWALSWKDDGAYTTWLTAMQERSLIKSDVSVTSSDRVITLSTCTNSGQDRFIVMGKLVSVTE